MYIYCKKDFKKITFKFKTGVKYPIVSIEKDCYNFINPENDHCDSISKSYLNENGKYLELCDDKVCNHGKENYIKMFGNIICHICHEIITEG